MSKSYSSLRGRGRCSAIPNPKYQKGRRLEWQVRDFFRERGYFVIRSAGSKQEADLISIKPAHDGELRMYHTILLVQCKATAKGADKKEREQLKALAARLGCVPVWATKTPKGKLHLERLDGLEEFGW